MQLGQPVPAELQEAVTVVDSGCIPTLEELNASTQEFVEMVLLYRAVRNAIETGKRLNI